MTSRKKPGVAFWAVVVVAVMLVIYPLSWGPYIWLDCHSRRGSWVDRVDVIYSPIELIRDWSPDWAKSKIDAYRRWWMPESQRF